MTSALKRVDNGLRNYYGHKGVPYDNEEDGIGKFCEWAEENGYDTDTMNEDFQTNPEDTSIVEFDEDFPTDKTGAERLDLIFKILTHCWKTPNAFKDSAEIPTKSKNGMSGNYNDNTSSNYDLQYAQAISASLADQNNNNNNNNKYTQQSSSSTTTTTTTTTYDYNTGSMFGGNNGDYYNLSSSYSSNKNDGWDHGNCIVGDFWKTASKPKDKYNINYFDADGNPKKIKV